MPAYLLIVVAVLSRLLLAFFPIPPGSTSRPSAEPCCSSAHGAPGAKCSPPWPY